MSTDSFQNWDGTPKGAIALQKELRSQIQLVPLKEKPELISGCDVSMNLFATHGFAGFVTLSYPTLITLTQSVVREKISFPYIPGLLSFREIPMLLHAWEGLTRKPDILMVDGVGIAHPRRVGIATHLGLLLNIPTIGCSKNNLFGNYDEPEDTFGAISYIQDPTTSEILGAALRTKVGVKPVFISPGTLLTVEEAIEIAKRCILKHRLPEPTRRAHLAVNEYRIQSMQ